MEFNLDELDQAEGRPRFIGGGGGLHQAIVGIKMVDGRRSHELVIDEDRGWHGSLIQNIQAHLHQVGAVTFRKKSNCPDEPSVCFTHFGTALCGSVLTHDGANIGATGSFKRSQRTNRTDIIDGSYQYAR